MQVTASSCVRRVTEQSFDMVIGSNFKGLLPLKGLAAVRPGSSVVIMRPLARARVATTSTVSTCKARRPFSRESQRDSSARDSRDT